MSFTVPDNLMPVLVLATSLVTGLIIFFLGEAQHQTRTALNLAGAALKLVLIGIMLRATFVGLGYETRLIVAPDLVLLLRIDTPGLFFATLSAGLWLLTTVYAVGYLEGSPHRSRFFGFFSLCVTATMGIALAGNLFTFFIFYELLTVTTYPLVVHRGTHAALRAGDTYLRYTLAGGAVLLVGVVWLHALVGPVEFVEGGALLTGAAQGGGGVPPAGQFSGPGRESLIPIFFLLVIGLGVKAALVPLHGWLPVAMVAPAPVSALLHAVAVVKAGAFGIVRVVYDVFGVQFAADLGVTRPLAAVAAATILYGSLRALGQDDLKRRLAYSTVSQISYIILGVAVVGPLSTIGGVVHLVHQGIMKITLFFCAGNLAETLGIHRVSELNGVGRRMPVTMAAFTLAAFGMIGVPPTAGFVTKWYLGLGALQAGAPWVLAVLGISALLNAGYFLPILHAAWFASPDEKQAAPGSQSDSDAPERRAPLLVFPTVAAAAIALAAGLLAGSGASPLSWARLIADREWYP